MFDTKKRKMGNALSIPDKLYQSDDDIINYVSENADLFLDLADELKEDGGSNKRRRIRAMTKKDWNETSWGKMIGLDKEDDPEALVAIRDVNTREGQEFRRRFRVPAPFFLDWLVPECKRVNIFNSKISPNGEQLGHIPIEIKIMIALRLLARGNVVEDLTELSKAGGTTVRNIFKIFVLNFAQHFRKEFIRMPTDQT